MADLTDLVKPEPEPHGYDCRAAYRTYLAALLVSDTLSFDEAAQNAAYCVTLEDRYVAGRRRQTEVFHLRLIVWDLADQVRRMTLPVGETAYDPDSGISAQVSAWLTRDGTPGFYALCWVDPDRFAPDIVADAISGVVGLENASDVQAGACGFRVYLGEVEAR